MSVTGGVKFFEPSLCLFKNGSTAVANSNSGNAVLVLNYDKDSTWVSSGSTEGVAATITITLPAGTTFNRLMLLNHNFKTYTITYGAGATNFANVITANNVTMANITETAYADSGSYYEFDSVTTTQINISCTNVQNPAVTTEKYLGVLFISTEIGTLSVDGLPKLDPQISANNRVAQNINNKAIVQRGLDSFSCTLSAQLIYDQADADIFTALYDRNEDFMVLLCGGRAGSTYFRIKAKPFRLEDLYRVRNTASLDNGHYKGLFNTGIQQSLKLIEVEG